MRKINKFLVFSFLYMLLLTVALAGIMGIILWRMNAASQQEIVDEETFQVGEILNHFDPAAADWSVLSNNLIPFGYNLLVAEGNHMVFSNLENHQYLALERFQALNIMHNTVIGKTSENIAYIIKPAETYTFFALKNVADNDTKKERIRMYIIFCVIIVLIIIPSSIFYTKKIIQSIKTPIQEMTLAAKQMTAGAFEAPIPYLEQDEHAAIAKALNQMREFVLAERKISASYEEAHTNIISGISTDLRAPLTTVKNYTKILLDGSAQTPAQKEQYLAAAHSMICDMDALLQKLFLLSSLETGNLQMILTSLDLGVFLRQFAEDMRDEFKQSNIQFNLEITPAFHTVKVDQVQLQRVLVNLTENAMKYADVDPLQLRISLWAENGIEYLLFADNGQGILPKDLPHIYEQFWRSDKAHSVKAGAGSGLGLYIVKYIVEAHGGTISVQNNHGLQFIIALHHNDEDFMLGS